MTAYDPYDDAQNAKPRANVYYGLINIDAYPVVLIKGTGKVPFNPQQHAEEKRVTNIVLTLSPLSEHKATYTVSRDCLASSKAWAAIALPSIKALGIETKAINGMYAKIELVPTGETFKGRDGTDKKKDFFKFIAIFKTEDECRAMYYTDHGMTPNAGQTVAAPVATPATGNDARRPAALAFLKIVVAKNLATPENLATAISTAPLVKEFFTIDSPEVSELLTQGYAPQAA